MVFFQKKTMLKLPGFVWAFVPAIDFCVDVLSVKFWTSVIVQLRFRSTIAACSFSVVQRGSYNYINCMSLRVPTRFVMCPYGLGAHIRCVIKVQDLQYSVSIKFRTYNILCRYSLRPQQFLSLRLEADRFCFCVSVKFRATIFVCVCNLQDLHCYNILCR